jgi:CRP-like cAMP-binding protein
MIEVICLQRTCSPMPEAACPSPMADLARPRELIKGEVVFQLGAPARHVYFLQRGRVLLHRYGPGGEEVVIHAAAAGEFFAEASLHSEHYHCTAVAAEPGRVEAIESAALRLRILSDSTFAMEWVETVSRQLRRLRARVERLSLRSAAERVDHLLLTEGQGKPPAYTPGGTLRQLAAELGLTHEALYRTLSVMERDGRIARRDGRLLRLG